jgi:serine/threonine protein kinase
MVAKLADFGLAKLAGGSSYTLGAGHPGFVPPEIITEDDAPVLLDIWSFGILVCEVLYLSVGMEYKGKLHKNITDDEAK